MMQNKVYFFILGVVLWLGFGAIVGSFSANLIGYTWIAQAAAYGAAIGLVVGVVVSLAGLAALSRFRTSVIMLWMLAGSIFGAGAGFKSVILLGGYPNQSQADLSFVVLAPVGLALGAVLGAIAGLLLWKYSHSAST